MLANVYRSSNVVCPDASLAGQHGGTCYEAPIELRADGTADSDRPISLGDTYFYATFNPGPQFDPEMLFAGFFQGPIGSNVNLPHEVDFSFDRGLSPF